MQHGEWKGGGWKDLGIRAWRQRVLDTPGGAVEGVRACIERIDALNPTYNAVNIVLEKQALASAEALDNASARPGFVPGPLHGVPILIKDEVDVAGAATTFGSAGNSTVKTADSLLVTRLREAGAIIVGKTTMPAFGAFPFTESEAFGITRNPWDPTRTPGGSSGGSAVAVATGMVPAAIGGDGGGSIRIPSAHCGLTGLKPARGSVPTAPYRDLWMALGTAGPIARSVEDCALIFDAISSSSTHSHIGESSAEGEERKLLIGVHTRPATPGIRVHPDHLKAVRDTARKLEAAGHEVREVKLRHPDPTVAFVTQFFGGIRSEIKDLEYPERIEPRHKRTRVMGAWVTPRVEKRARNWSERFGEIMDGQLSGFDALLTPAVASRPARAGRHLNSGTIRTQLASLSSVAFAAQWNVSGHAAMVLPAGLGTDGVPVGIQLVGPRAEADLLTVSALVEGIISP